MVLVLKYSPHLCDEMIPFTVRSRIVKIIYLSDIQLQNKYLLWQFFKKKIINLMHNADAGHRFLWAHYFLRFHASTAFSAKFTVYGRRQWNFMWEKEIRQRSTMPKMMIMGRGFSSGIEMIVLPPLDWGRGIRQLHMILWDLVDFCPFAFIFQDFADGLPRWKTLPHAPRPSETSAVERGDMWNVRALSYSLALRDNE